ncbi:unnamed protein product [Brassica oleracea]
MAKKNPSFSQAKEKKKNAASQDSPTAVVLRSSPVHLFNFNSRVW